MSSAHKAGLIQQFRDGRAYYIILGGRARPPGGEEDTTAEDMIVPEGNRKLVVLTGSSPLRGAPRLGLRQLDGAYALGVEPRFEWPASSPVKLATLTGMRGSDARITLPFES
jgi:hypothetical protein